MKSPITLILDSSSYRAVRCFCLLRSFMLSFKEVFKRNASTPIHRFQRWNVAHDLLPSSVHLLLMIVSFKSRIFIIIAPCGNYEQAAPGRCLQKAVCSSSSHWPTERSTDTYKRTLSTVVVLYFWWPEGTTCYRSSDRICEHEEYSQFLQNSLEKSECNSKRHSLGIDTSTFLSSSEKTPPIPLTTSPQLLNPATSQQVSPKKKQQTIKPLSSQRHHTSPPKSHQTKSPFPRPHFLPILTIRQNAQMRKPFRLTRNRSLLLQIKTLVRIARRVILLLLLKLWPRANSAFPPGKERPHGRETSAQNADAEFDDSPDLRAGIGPFLGIESASRDVGMGCWKSWGVHLQVGSVRENSWVRMQR